MKSNKLHRHGLTNIREMLGLNQQKMAEWLGISRSLVGYYETGKRKLPGDALLQVARVETLLAEIKTENLAPKNINDPSQSERARETAEHFDRESELFKMKAERMRRKLAEMQTRYQQEMRWREIASRLLIEKNTDKRDKRLYNWLNGKKAKAGRSILKFDEIEQSKLQKKIEILEATSKILKLTTAKPVVTQPDLLL